MTIPDPRPPDAQEIRADLEGLGVAATPDHDHLLATACGLGLGEELRSLIRTVAATADPTTSGLGDERATLPHWLAIGLYDEWWRGGWWACFHHAEPACAGSQAWRTPHRVAAAARAHLAEAHTPGEPASVRAAHDARQEARNG